MWQSFWSIILPSLLWCSVAGRTNLLAEVFSIDNFSTSVTGVGSVYSVSQATTNTSDIFANETGQWITAFYASTLTTNLLSSGKLMQPRCPVIFFNGMLGLLAYRIWTIGRNVRSLGVSTKNTMKPVLRVLIDAALLYSATLLTALVCFANANNGQFIVLDMVNCTRFMVFRNSHLSPRSCRSSPLHST